MALSDFQIGLLTDALTLCVQVFSRLTGQIRIDSSFDDLLPDGAVCRSREQLSATAMSVAAISDGDAYKDSGRRYFFAIENGVAKVRSGGEPLRIIVGERDRARHRVLPCAPPRRYLAPAPFQLIASCLGRVLFILNVLGPSLLPFLSSAVLFRADNILLL